MSKGKTFPFTKSSEYQEAVKNAQAALLGKLDPTLRDFWAAYDEDQKGSPEARLKAVKLASVLRTSYGMGARKAATVMGREDGDNGAQRYFDVAKGIEEGLIREEDVLSTGVTALYSYIRERRKSATSGQEVTEPDRVAAALKTFERIRKAVLKAEGQFNALECITLWLTGVPDMLSAPEARGMVKSDHIVLKAVAAPEEAPVVEGTEDLGQQQEEAAPSTVEQITVPA